MKELSIEEKVRHYDRALKQIKECTPDENGFVTIYPNEIFPELAVSEDERIRKSIIGFLITISSLRDGKTVINEDFDSKEILEWVAWLEKQGEQKPAEWSEEDEMKRNLLINILRVNHPNGLFKVNPANTLNMEAMHTKELVEWLKSLKPQSRWKPSDEQMKILNEVLNFAANHESPHWNDYIFGTLNNLIRQLKKL